MDSRFKAKIWFKIYHNFSTFFCNYHPWSVIIIRWDDLHWNFDKLVVVMNFFWKGCLKSNFENVVNLCNQVLLLAERFIFGIKFFVYGRERVCMTGCSCCNLTVALHCLKHYSWLLLLNYMCHGYNSKNSNVI